LRKKIRLGYQEKGQEDSRRNFAEMGFMYILGSGQMLAGACNCPVVIVFGGDRDKFSSEQIRVHNHVRQIRVQQNHDHNHHDGHTHGRLVRGRLLLAQRHI